MELLSDWLHLSGTSERDDENTTTGGKQPSGQLAATMSETTSDPEAQRDNQLWEPPIWPEDNVQINGFARDISSQLDIPSPVASLDNMFDFSIFAESMQASMDILDSP